MEEKEIWKPVVGFENLYEVSNMGRVKSLERTVWSGLNGGCYITIPERILKPRKASGYLQVALYKDGKGKWCLVHRLVASAFIPNPQGLPEVNHISEDKADNNLENLEWVSPKENVNHGTRNKRMAEKKSKAVVGVHIVTGEKVFFPSIIAVERQIGIDQASICKCCKGKQKIAGNYTWHYVDDKEVNNG